MVGVSHGEHAEGGHESVFPTAVPRGIEDVDRILRGCECIVVCASEVVVTLIAPCVEVGELVGVTDGICEEVILHIVVFHV